MRRGRAPRKIGPRTRKGATLCVGSHTNLRTACAPLCAQLCVEPQTCACQRDAATHCGCRFHTEMPTSGATPTRRCDFLDSLFELADVWTEEIDAQEYADFLDLTRRTVSDRFPEGSRWKRIVRPGGFHFELAKVVAIAEKKAEEEERARKMEGLRQKKEARGRVAPVLRLPIVHTVGSWPHKRRTRPLVLHPWQSCGFSRCPAGGRKAAEKAGAPGEQSSCQGPGSSSWSRRAKKDQGGKAVSYTHLRAHETLMNL
eukprot:6491261-Prymnesium_polylepis.2